MQTKEKKKQDKKQGSLSVITALWLLFVKFAQADSEGSLLCSGGGGGGVAFLSMLLCVSGKSMLERVCLGLV